jgi:hypothetical protein
LVEKNVKERPRVRWALFIQAEAAPTKEEIDSERFAEKRMPPFLCKAKFIVMTTTRLLLTAKYRQQADNFCQ